MSTILLKPLAGRFWRMLGVKWQHQPFESGAHLTGGRWNRPGCRALYLSRDVATAVAEMHQDLIRPGTLAAYDVASNAIADLTDDATRDAVGIDVGMTASPWRSIFQLERGVPPSWPAADRLVAKGADGALVPSAQSQGGVNLVLWRWHDAATGAGNGAALTLLDPQGDLSPRR